MEVQKKSCSVKPIINHEKKFIYIFIPKNASSTIRDCLFGRLKGLAYIFYQDVNYYNDYFKFVFVRNPYDRFLSFYKDNIRGDMSNKFEFRQYGQWHRIKSIDDLIVHVFENNDSQLDYHIKPQSWFVKDLNLDFICNVENFNSDMQKIKIILDINTPHRHLRKTINKYELTRDQKKLIYERYEEDFRRFGYAK
jgi:hypothetical protein